MLEMVITIIFWISDTLMGLKCFLDSSYVGCHAWKDILRQEAA